MPLILPGNVASATAGAYEVANSCRFFTDTVMKRTNAATSTNGTQGCFSTWIKKCNISGTGGGIITGYVDSSNYSVIYFDSDHRLCYLEYQSGSSAGFLRTPNIFRDPSAWYHIAYLFDTTQGTAANRVKVYVNGTQITSFHSGGTTQPAEDLTLKMFAVSASLDLGQDTTGSPHFMNGYLAETLLVDGTTVAIGDLGEFDEDSPTIWKPKDISGISVGTNGFYCDYEASDNLGNAVDGGTDLTETNLDATDQATDTPTNNFCTLNPLYNWDVASTLSEGNCKAVGGSGWASAKGTMAVSKGKWYWEIKLSGTMTSHQHGVQEINLAESLINPQIITGSTIFYNGDGGEIKTDGAATTNDYGTLDDGDILGIALDMDAGSYGQITFYDQNAAIASDISLAASSDYVMPFLTTNSSTAEVNFGGCSAFTVSSSANDENGYGNFEYAPPAGYLALCTKNLATDG